MKKHVFLLFFFLVISSMAARAQEEENRPQKSVNITQTDIEPKIDGIIEDLWLSGDSAINFIQHTPYEKTAPTERTVVYLLQDAENLYVAFRCHADKNPPVACFTKDEDYVTIKIDPFGSRTGGYFFLVFGSGLFWDGLIMDDGRSQDLSWEGVWYNSVKMYPDRMEVEMKIPFKTLRYKKGLMNWGVQFARHIATNREDDYWTEVTQKDDDLVSRWGVAQNINPRSSGYYFELYPEGFLRYEDFKGRTTARKVNGSLTAKWDLTPQTSINATAYPDFAQIESDPSSVNLSRYPTYLQEQRPFFVEGREIFRFSEFQGSGFFQPLNIFYSRRVGKSIDGGAVPIIGGLKVTHKTEGWNIGALAAYTEKYDYSYRGLPLTEPERKFGVLRATRRVLNNSDIGLLFSGMSANADEYNYAAGLDASLRKGPNQLILQGAYSDESGKKGMAVSTGFRGFIDKFLIMSAYEAVDDSFSVEGIGYVPWTGRQRALFIGGPFWTFRQASLRNLYIAPGIARVREPGCPEWSTAGYFSINPNWRNNWGANLELNYGRNYELIYNPFVGREECINYISRDMSFNFWGFLMGNNINGGCDYNYSYNYARNYLAYQGSNWLTFSYSIISPLSTTLTSMLWVEWDPGKEIVAMTPIFRPRMDYRITAKMTLSVFNEMVGTTPESNFEKTRLYSDRFGLLYSWNFSPKSWLYVALNDYNSLDYGSNPDGEMTQRYIIGAIKARYLLYF
ncbi:MAG: hypothetical protein A2509_01000 [Candidatus Edwardsbacteria bacterium RIFOXYD12_FULL_50_11]|uniref:DUF5916 domain-containing protein n=1 Tax=Candidatus Edwardsbacteria bacterium GWF2_54_11 TaxID=1817851 RepID=A0A1F5RDE4_9BACT|nr:MAG: hypothetical protein A2502_07480 [Candidatus Edwardsbacteria bacterium RifOxyC12_full_54_24]OGF07561.1 MAG: hypothetical protein A2273_03580 [Candidatus Edwardsbacteria bacterium RifOxyA12_full_54_48]OGF09811.1 MAG: hypothetical protein A3K15_09990 [Candidatus Edwardsbacteria bacterium GWE2_54_12]OGF12073.1 MAG: hypothetical protein A2024_03545 [Candidatus Edwardsbacteria bacterium GWF2_54_11]OGF16172.1 MAG: hypothetical protein A2509_01000 [Candidatus Edwardsbacteria bacterium RIFOXYD1